MLPSIPACALFIPALWAPTPQSVDYISQVRPILADRCFACHGPDEATREADLRLDSREDVLRERGRYAVIVPGDVDESELILRISDDIDPMPPKEHEGLSREEIDLLTRWVAEGAAFAGHWAYAAPRRTQPEELAKGSWPRNSVDHFILAGIEGAGLVPAEPADPRSFVRRLSFDLLGLPPTSDRVRAFALDPGAEAREALIEEWLASPQHAERLATFWFDLVRFADTTGIHADNPWHISPYRDWVIDAFRSNMPFDRFTVEQLAGDLLAEPTLSQQVAAAYNRLNLITREGGSQPKEFLVRYTADRVRNVSEVWLATTLGCAQCHDHKFDPLTTREFYEFGAFFADIEQVGVYSQSGTDHFPPELEVPSADQSAELARLESEIDAIELELTTETPALVEDRRAWEEERRSGEWASFDEITVSADGDTHLEIQADGSWLATGGDAPTDSYRATFLCPQEGLRSLRLELLPHESLPQSGPGRAKNGNLVLSELEVFVNGEKHSIASSRASFEQPNYPVAAAHDGERGRKGWAVMRDGQGSPAEAIFTLAESLSRGGSDSEARVEVVIHQDYGGLHTLGRWRLTGSTRSELEPLDPDLRGALTRDAAKRSPEETKRINDLHRSQTPLLAEQRDTHRRLREALESLRSEIPLVLQTRAVEPMVTRVLPRGNWMDESGEVVTPGVPAAFAGDFDLGEAPDRLDLARWLVAEENPLVARVLVNRLWRLFLGRGLVTSLDDFGVQGSAPSHPELLDYLALELVDSGWDVRHVIRLIVSSATYAQASGIYSLLDEESAWFASQQRFRLDAEFVRDNALAVSGLLVQEVGGASVRPYQPAGYWAHLNFPKRTYSASSGKDLYRRALYGHWQRQYLHPSLLAFDAPSRERCTAKRSRSNTPQAALALLNDPIFVEAARALAQSTCLAVPEGGEERVTWMWQQVLQRDPRASELELVLELVETHREHFATNPEEAERLLSIGESVREVALDAAEHAAWTSAARVVLNLHETIVRN